MVKRNFYRVPFFYQMSRFLKGKWNCPVFLNIYIMGTLHQEDFLFFPRGGFLQITELVCIVE
jgi:hypothetical protein